MLPFIDKREKLLKIVELREGIKVVVDIFLLLITIAKNVHWVEELLILDSITSIYILNTFTMNLHFIPKQFGFQTYLNRIVLFQGIVIKLKQENIHKTLD